MHADTNIRLGDRWIGPGQPCFVIAEAGINHNGDPARARALVDAAVAASADAVKFQTYKAELVISESAPKAGYQLENTDPEETQLDMVRKCQLSYADFRSLRKYCDDRGIIFLSTPFDHDSLGFLVELGVPALKIASGEVTNLPLLSQAAASGLPVILSTGMSDLTEVETAVRTLRNGGCRDLVVLHCLSNYPAAPADANLRAMATMADALDVLVGYSDHTLGLPVALASVALGACVLEKHFTLDKGLPGPDHVASLDPTELTALVRAVREVESALGDGRKVIKDSEASTRAVARRSLFLALDLAAGETLRPGDLVALRPGGGIAPGELATVSGRRAVRALTAGTMLAWQDIT